MMQLNFTTNESALTLGVEMEIQLLDPITLRLSPSAPEILRMIEHQRLTKEMFRSTLELVTGVCADVHEVHHDLGYTLKEVKVACHAKNLFLAGTGTHPLADYNNRILSDTPRYHELVDRNQWLIRRMSVYGLHVHIGMHDGDACIRFNNFFLHFIPQLIALSASSPFWRGKDTGLDASRPTTYEAHPTSGLPVIVENWDEFNTLYEHMVRTRSIQSMKDIWWDLRPSPGYGTLEIRICDGPASMLELESIVAWIHLLAHWYQDHAEEFAANNDLKPMEWVLRENKWRAIRYGLEAAIISYKTLDTIRLCDQINYWLVKVKPYIQKLGYQKYEDCIRNILEKGNSSSRQRNIMKQTGILMDVVRHNILEFERGEPIWN
jgi:carboxylate-amine ligase